MSKFLPMNTHLHINTRQQNKETRSISD